MNGLPFTDLRAEGCCHSVDVLFSSKTNFSIKLICTIFVLYLVRWSPVNIMETIAGDLSNQIRLLTKH